MLPLRETMKGTMELIQGVRPMMGCLESWDLVNEKSEESVLEAFIGKVERVEGNTAFVKLVDSKGQQSFAEYSATKFARQGIEEGSNFTCTVIERENEITIRFEPMETTNLSQQEEEELRRETEELLGDYDPRDDY